MQQKNPIPPVTELNNEEKAFLRDMVEKHMRFYQTLAGSTRVTQATRDKLTWFATLYSKLT